MEKDIISKCLNALDKAGWSELIDPRFEEQVVKTLKKKVPEASYDDIQTVLKIVLTN